MSLLNSYYILHTQTEEWHVSNFVNDTSKPIAPKTDGISGS